MRWPTYPRYKPSGVEWLGDVPEHWEVKKITYGFRTIGSGTTPKSDSDDYYDGDVPWVTTSELRETVIRQTRQSVTRSALADYSTLRLYPVGTLLFAMYGATIGRLGILGVPATVNQACCAFAWPCLFDSKFTFYWLWMRRPILVSLSSGGGQPNLSQDDLRQLRLPIPPLPEQRAITDFLDRETGRMDRLMEKKRELIERLKEKRCALISRTVTRGLNPNAKLKPSGIEWLGDVPEHWTWKRLGYETNLQGGYAFPSDGFDNEGVPVVQMNNLKGGRLDLSSARCISADEATTRFALCAGDIIIGMTGSLENFAVVQAADLPAQLNQRVGRFRTTGGLIPRFLLYVIQTSSFKDQVRLLASGTAQLNISSREVESAFICVPPVRDQQAIADYLDRETAKLDALAAKVEAAIERLQEYRTALITAAVTGKIDITKQRGGDGRR